jgi:hypothetical protein
MSTSIDPSVNVVFWFSSMLIAMLDPTVLPEPMT